MRTSLTRAMLLGIALFAILTPPLKAQTAGGKEQVDMLLVLAADTSRSVDNDEFQMQRDGYAAALVDPRVLRAIRSGPLGRIGVAYVEWSHPQQQKVVVEWSIIDGQDSALHFAEQMTEVPRAFLGNTAIGAAIDFCAKLLEEAPFTAERMTIDISGDGTNNMGRDINAARNDAVGKGIVINGLVILSPLPIPWNPEHTHPPGGLENYYRDNVIGGPGAFVVVAEDFKSFGAAIAKKMIAEIAAR